jgi:hypothetical protein
VCHTQGRTPRLERKLSPGAQHQQSAANVTRYRQEQIALGSIESFYLADKTKNDTHISHSLSLKLFLCYLSRL